MTWELGAMTLVGLTVTGLAIKAVDAWVVVNAMREKISPGELNDFRKAATGKNRNRSID